MAWKKLITGILCLIMIVSAAPAMAFAGEPETQGTTDDAAVIAESVTVQEADAVLPEPAIREIETVDDLPDVREENLIPPITTEPEIISDAPEIEATNDELLQGYIDRELFADETVTLMDSGASAALSGVDLKIYKALKKHIKAVAEGKQSSAVFTITLEELGVSGFWSAADLGVSAIVRNNQITSAASKALYSKIEIDGAKVMDALLADCPYDLYWYDKTTGYQMTEPGLITDYDYKKQEHLLAFTSDVTFYFAVASEYADGWFRVNRTSAVSKALKTMKSIVAKHAAEDDLTKLHSYRKEICSRVSYNNSAAQFADWIPYGNPWQLIWVFDGDASTNVVCEGYSKAFQYLCDLSTFADSGIRSRIVSGQMSGGFGAGAHMWNVVTMNNGKNYLVDVTNCDSGSVGEDDLLFLAGYKTKMTKATVDDFFYVALPSGNIYYCYDNDTLSIYKPAKLVIAKGKYNLHEHEVYKVDRVEPTFKTTGNISYWICESCGRYFKDKAATQGLSASKTVLAKLVPKTTSISGLTATKRAFTVKWKKQTTRTTGYQIQYSTSKSFASGNKTVTVKNLKTVSKKIKSLKSGKTYYVRIRTYKKIGSKMYYSAWSKKKSVKTK